MPKIIHYIQKKSHLISICVVVVFFVGFLIFSYIYLEMTFMESKFVALFAVEADAYPAYILPTEDIVAKHLKKIQKIEIDWLKIKDIFVSPPSP